MYETPLSPFLISNHGDVAKSHSHPLHREKNLGSAPSEICKLHILLIHLFKSQYIRLVLLSHIPENEADAAYHDSPYSYFINLISKAINTFTAT
jgi:hypothetical protein